jgi:hypothetical protein
MRTHVAALLPAAVLAVALAAPRPADAQEDAWWTQRITFGEGPALVENLWSRGPRMRAESVFDGHTIVTLVDERRYMIIDELRRTGVSIERSKLATGQDEKRKRPFGNEGEDLLKKGAEKVGTEMRAGEEVDHYRITHADGDRTEAWLTKDAQKLPMEAIYRDRETGTMNRKVYLRWVQTAFPDAFFRPDDGVKLEQISYEDYLARSKQGGVGPAPPFYGDLLHGVRE